jgi:hypothetical protein
MTAVNDDPYAGNLLIEQLGPIRDSRDALIALTHLPKRPSDIAQVPKHVRLHQLSTIVDFHIPPQIERQLLQTIDLLIRQGYRHRDPRHASTWAAVSGEVHSPRIQQHSLSAAVEGLSGVGKTQGCLRCLSTFPQVIHHSSFPQVVGGLTQVVWLSVEIPPSGKAIDLARALMQAWKQSTNSTRFDAWLEKERSVDGMRALEEWRQVATSHFLGVLHLDEVQNLFRIASLKARKSRSAGSGAPELSIVEDQVLRWLLQLTNSGQIPLLFSGTPDGIGALTKRFSTAQRINTGGYHAFDPFIDSKAQEFLKTFLPALGVYQYVAKPIPVNQELADLIVELTGGIQRLIIALWVAAHRVAFERKADELCLDDFRRAAATSLAPLQPMVSALRSKDARQMAKYEDLVPRDTAFWSRIWGQPTSL